MIRTSLAALSAAALLAAPAAPAQTGDPRKDEAHALRLEVGESVKLCRTGTILCPACAAVCDDPKVAEPASGPDGLELRGVGPGTTFCSASSQCVGARRVYRVTVVRPEPRPSPGG